MNNKRENETRKDKQGVIWYREKIVDMVEQIEDEDYIFKIYHYILAKYRRAKKPGRD